MNVFKTFIHRTLEGLERRVNEWLAQQYREITYIQFYKEGNFYYLVILYKEAESTL